MKFYATLNENKICTGISQLSGEVIQDDMIEITSADASYMWKKYENGKWSVGTFEPISTAPVEEFETLKADNIILKQKIYDAEQVANNNSLDYQKLLETLIESEVI
ncbi:MULTISPECIES: hypothetical protein [Clostridium]|uniref:Uncharacterized protein n=1 Tax=Clostridium frigoriphilum TaxID=443253 RepID=A0ABU7UVZ0_9CLOT|nr:hypothetical protein [Clostridium sp. DSM 17811]MBU3098756.1 hypothetical protein [Clostridium sp. DSM 17811]